MTSVQDIPEIKLLEYRMTLGMTTMEGRGFYYPCLLYTSPSPRDGLLSRMPSSA